MAQSCTIETVAGNGEDTGSTWGDGGRAVEAMIRDPESIVVDSSGNLFISGRSSDRIRKVTPDGMISTFAIMDDPHEIAIDSEGNLYVQSSGRIKKITPAGIISTVVGGCSSGCSREDGVPVNSFEAHPSAVAVNVNNRQLTLAAS